MKKLHTSTQAPGARRQDDTCSLPPTPVQVPESLRQAVGGHPLVAEILARRGILTPLSAQAFLDPERYTPSPPSALPDLPAAAHHLADALAGGQCIGVWGDFDVDGQTATALLVSTLQSLGAEVVYYIPNRLSESHGIRLPALERFLDQGVRLLLTCDTGIEAHEAVSHARRRGAVVLVTDHHDVPEQLPQAEAVVNPKRLPADHPLHDLPGVGVAYMLAQALHTLAGDAGAAQRHLDLVALGIVADVAEQRADTRYLLQRGLARLRRSERVGVLAMFEAARIDPTHLSAEHIGFGLGPRLNAVGRLGDAREAVELLTTHDWSRARILAAQLEGLNEQRKLLSERVYAEAQEQIAGTPSLLDSSVLVLAQPGWHGGVIGPVAGRLAEQYARPAILITLQAGAGRGSARSTPGCDIHAAIKLAGRYLLGYGGHPGAAGLSIEARQVDAFRQALSQAVESVWDRSVAPPSTQIDACIGLNELSLELAIELERLAPFGQGNPPIRLLTRNLELVSQRTFGRNGEHRELSVQDEAGIRCKLVWWRGAEQDIPAGHFDLAYLIKSTNYQGRRTLEIEWVEAQSLEEPAVELAAPSRLELVDWRGQANLAARLSALLAGGDVQVWVEGAGPETPGGRRRHELGAASTLVVWNAPPGPRELHTALARVSPRRVIVCAVESKQPDSARPFLHRLAGLLKYDLTHRGGQVCLPALAAASGQRLATVRKGIEWLAARGQIAIAAWDGDELHIVAAGGAEDQGAGTREGGIGPLESDLRTLLAETAAYRAYFCRATLSRLLAA
ncbi:MAG: single-stranded-DNA-specific exonuclease RecJ [Thermoflexales bacterium]|nr:single-stranded-DNA-specific exonuclease RecJ [Thermoflexales bacterium]